MKKISEKDQRIVRELQSNQKRFEIIFNNAPIGISIWGTNTLKCYEINRRTLEIMHRSREDVLTNGWESYTFHSDIEYNKKKLNEMQEGRIDGFVMEKRFITPQNELIWVNMTIASYGYTEDGEHLHMCMMEDITERRKYQDELQRIGFNDQLTGLGNRRAFESEFASMDKPANLPLSLAIADINGLKLTNDTFGHNAGDQLLKLIAVELDREFGDAGKVDRIGGDEFAVILPCTSKEEAQKKINRVTERLTETKIEECIVCSASFGVETKTGPHMPMRKVYDSAEYVMYRNKLHESDKMKQATIKAVVDNLNKKSVREKEHSRRVSELSAAVGRSLELTKREISTLEMAALLHDIGKIGIPLELLDKKGPLTDAEYAEVMKHTEKGYQLLRGTTEFGPIAEIVLSHHERVDGKGYPRGIKGEDIPLQSMIICITDAYDAMVSGRPYRKSMSKEEAIKELRANAGTQFNSKLVEVFVKYIEEGEQ